VFSALEDKLVLFDIFFVIIIGMKKELNVAELLREARKRAELTQRELANRSGKAQSAIARIESGKSIPTTATLNHLISAAGFEVQDELIIKPAIKSHMLNDVSRILKLTLEQRLQEIADVDHFIKEAKRV
jgi:transcriptional regulator with XRE-family HTH domain